MTASPPPILRVVVPIMGFTQRAGTSPGLVRLWRRMLARAAPDTLVLPPSTWDRDMRDLADLIAAVAPLARIGVAAYSWGAGWGFVQLAKALGKRGLTIQDAVLCDPVHRNPLMPWRAVFAPISSWFLGAPRITVPPNVREVHWFRQRMDLPAGHDVVAAKFGAPDLWRAGHDGTLVQDAIELRCGHSWADDHEDFHALALAKLLPSPAEETAAP